MLGPAVEPKKPIADAPPVKPEQLEPWLGIEVRPAVGGVEVTRVSRRSPAFRAGLRRGDVVTQIDSVRITSEEALLKAVARKSPEDVLKVTFSRDGGGAVELPVKLAAKPVY